MTLVATMSANPTPAESRIGLVADESTAQIGSAFLADSSAGLQKLGLHLVDGQGLPIGILCHTRSEIDRLFRSTHGQIQVDVSGIRGPEPPPGGYHAVRVRLWPRDGGFLHLDPTVMGVTRVNDAETIQSVHVFEPVVVSTLLRDGESIEDLADLEIGRASVVDFLQRLTFRTQIAIIRSLM